jgi:hypothetical protein
VRRRLIRWALTAALLVGVYTETGPWTTAVLALLCVGHEIQTAFNEILIRRLDLDPEEEADELSRRRAEIKAAAIARHPSTQKPLDKDDVR